MEQEQIVRLAFFVGLLTVFGILELISPRRRLTIRKGIRWASNLGLVTLNSLSVPFILPILAMGMAALAAKNGWGALHMLGVAPWASVVISIVVLDLVIYIQHIAFHRIPILWRLHRVHHADVDFDVTTATRFHLIEIVISMLIKIAAVAALGAPVLAVLIFEVVLNGTALFNHANLRLPLGLDRVVRLFVVTPDMHRVHHSIYRDETDSNYGFNVPWWDRLFGTYCAQPRDGHEEMQIGLPIFRSERDQYFHRLLIQPFLKAEEKENNPPKDVVPSGDRKASHDQAVV